MADNQDDQGKVTADIADDVIRDALKSVEARERGEEPVEAAPAAQEAGADQPPPDPVAEVQAQLELSQAKGRETMERLKETHDRLLRATADLENVRKRAAKEKEDIQRFGVERIAKDLLGVVDSLERGIEYGEKDPETSEAMVTGVKMTLKLFQDALAKHGVKGFDSKGTPFDPHRHEAIGQAPDASVPANTVIVEHQRGYMLHDRLLRPALVVVSTQPAASEPSADEATPEDGADA